MNIGLCACLLVCDTLFLSQFNELHPLFEMVHAEPRKTFVCCPENTLIVNEVSFDRVSFALAEDSTRAPECRTIAIL